MSPRDLVDVEYILSGCICAAFISFSIGGFFTPCGLFSCGVDHHRQWKSHSLLVGIGAFVDCMGRF